MAGFEVTTEVATRDRPAHCASFRLTDTSKRPVKMSSGRIANLTARTQAAKNLPLVLWCMIASNEALITAPGPLQLFPLALFRIGSCALYQTDR